MRYHRQEGIALSDKDQCVGVQVGHRGAVSWPACSAIIVNYGGPEMKNLPTRFFATGVLFVLIGMIWGIEMSITQDFALAPAHAHLNLIGFVAMSIYGAFYALSPGARASKLAEVHYWLTVVAVVVFVPGIALAITQTSDAPAKIGSILVFLSMALFGFNVVRHGVEINGQNAAS